MFVYKKEDLKGAKSLFIKKNFLYDYTYVENILVKLETAFHARELESRLSSKGRLKTGQLHRSCSQIRIHSNERFVTAKGL